jgi:hypothetical protein
MRQPAKNLPSSTADIDQWESRHLPDARPNQSGLAAASIANDNGAIKKKFTNGKWRNQEEIHQWEGTE